VDASLAAVLVLAGLVLLRWGLVLFGALLILQPRRFCPACFGPTVPVRRRLLTVALPMAEWRSCLSCEWAGPVLKSPSLERTDPWRPNRER
jgi:hypothetical protein